MENTTAMNRKKNVAGTVIVGFSIILTVSLILGDHSISLLGTALRGADWSWIAAGFLLMLLYVVFEAESIRLLFRNFQRKVVWKRALAYTCVGFYFSAITPSATGGQPMQVYYMRRDRIELSQSSFTLMVITSFYQMVILLGGCLSVIIGHTYVGQLPVIVRWLLAIGALINGTCAVFLMFVFMNRYMAESILLMIVHILHRLHIIKDENRWKQKIDISIQEYSKGGAYLKKSPMVAVKVFAYTILKITALNLVPYCAGRALHIQGLRAMDFIMRQSLLNLAVTIVPLPGSMGASEATFILLYRNILTATQVNLAVILSRGISFYAILLISGLTVLYLGHVQKGR